MDKSKACPKYSNNSSSFTDFATVESSNLLMNFSAFYVGNNSMAFSMIIS
jgi:hypothetical protein